ncbi:MAG: hypothetical protein JWP57_2069 [Spirosoma sp.]|nr:hypothetical protein [Spirosoma sp.]
MFKARKLLEAQHKAGQTFCSNTYVLAKFVGRSIESLARYEQSAYAQRLAESFPYSNQRAELTDFGLWLEAFLASDAFMTHSARYVAIQERLETEEDRETRGYLVK